MVNSTATQCHGGLRTRRAMRLRAVLAPLLIFGTLIGTLGLTTSPASAQSPSPTWTELSPATSPPIREGASMAYDAAGVNLVLFGGFNGTSLLGDTWTWNGTTWTKASPATSPTPRSYASMAYDLGTSQLVLFGGSGQ